MLEVTYICPLKLPARHQSTPLRQRRHDHGFPPSLTIDQAVEFLEEELRALGAQRATVYSNVDRLNSTRSRAKRDEDSGVCCEIRLESRNYPLVCDRWPAIEHNLYALHLAIRALRNIAKWGVADLPQLLSAFDAAQVNRPVNESANGIILTDWMQTLGLGANASLDDANAIYRTRAKQAANDPEALLVLNQAIDAARRYFGGR